MVHLLQVGSHWVLISDLVYDWKIKSVDGSTVSPPRMIDVCDVSFSWDRQTVL